MATLKTKIQLRRDTAANLKDVKLVLGEPGYATDTKKFVIGDGSTKFSDLKGRIMGPNSSTDHALARFDGTSGQIIQNSNATLDDDGNLKIAGDFYVPAQKYAYFGTNKLASFRANANGAFIVGAYDDIYFRGNLDSNDSSSQASGIQLSETYLKPEATNTMALGASDKIWSNVYSRQLTSTVATGTAPLVVTSTTAVTNLNADMLDGKHASAFALTSDILTYTFTSGEDSFKVTPSGGSAQTVTVTNRLIQSPDTRSTSYVPEDVSKGVVFDFKNKSAITSSGESFGASGSYLGVMT